ALGRRRAGRGGFEGGGAFVEEGCSGRVEIFRWGVLLEGAPAEGDDAATQVGDGKHDAIAEAIVGDRNVLARDQQSRLDHVLGRDPRLAEMFLEREAFGWRIA